MKGCVAFLALLLSCHVCAARARVAAPNYTGFLEAANCNTISGWAADRSRPNVAINVSVVFDSAHLITVLANGPRPDVGQAVGDNGLHGFSVPFPTAMRNGSQHTLEVRFEASTVELPSVPSVAQLPLSMQVNSGTNESGSSPPKGDGVVLAPAHTKTFTLTGQALKDFLDRAKAVGFRFTLSGPTSTGESPCPSGTAPNIPLDKGTDFFETWTAKLFDRSGPDRELLPFWKLKEIKVGDVFSPADSSDVKVSGPPSGEAEKDLLRNVAFKRGFTSPPPLQPPACSSGHGGILVRRGRQPLRVRPRLSRHLDHTRRAGRQDAGGRTLPAAFPPAGTSQAAEGQTHDAVPLTAAPRSSTASVVRAEGWEGQGVRG